MPKLWNETIEAHRRTVHDAVLDAAAALAAEHGPLAVTMSQLAAAAGIGRATLYKYFPDVESVMVAWHDREIAGHLRRLTDARDRADGPGRRLQAVLESFALIQHEHAGRRHRHAPSGAELGRLVHQHEHVVRARRHLLEMFRDLLADAARAGDVRDDVDPGELADYCHHALHAAADLPSGAAVHRLVQVTLAGLRPPPPGL